MLGFPNRAHPRHLLSQTVVRRRQSTHLGDAALRVLPRQAQQEPVEAILSLPVSHDYTRECGLVYGEYPQLLKMLVGVDENAD